MDLRLRVTIWIQRMLARGIAPSATICQIQAVALFKELQQKHALEAPLVQIALEIVTRPERLLQALELLVQRAPASRKPLARGFLRGKAFAQIPRKLAAARPVAEVVRA